MEKKEYYLGLDLGTSSVGWAVTDSRYKLQRFNKKDMWGARLFDEASTAQETRTHRSSRRRNERKKKRVRILQELFAKEIEKVDPTFFMRLKESKFHLEDKKVNQKYTLFNDDNFTDKEYNNKYPTAYHLRKDLIYDQSKKDIRLIYLALHHIIKYRGHFLFEGQDFSVEEAFGGIFSKLADFLFDQFQMEVPVDKYAEIEKILLDRDLNLRDKSNALSAVCETKDKQFKDILSVMIGGKRKLSAIFNNPELDEAEKKEVDFTTSSFDEEHDLYEQVLNEDILLLDLLKAVYDWMILSGILESHKLISDAKISAYDQHGVDLQDLKYLIRKYGKESLIDKNGKVSTKGDYKESFNDIDVKNNYVSYIRTTLSNGKNKADKSCNQEEVNDFFNKKLQNYKVDESDCEVYERIIKRLERKIALPKLRTSDNSVIPYQVHKMELDMILNNASKHYPFLNKIDETGLTIIEKIQKTMVFKIPYYIGPLNTYHSEYNGGHGNAWMVKRKDMAILPWNFEEVVDEEQSAERFIRRMTNKCTYVLGADVIPNNSLLYEKFKVLNELNNLKLDGKQITVDLKKEIYNDLFKEKKKVTQKMLRTYLKKRGMPGAEDTIISGVDGDFKSSLTSYHIFKGILGDKINFEPTKSHVEKIILWKCIFESGGKIVKEKISAEFSDIFTKEEIKKIHNKNFSGWGRFSQQFLKDIEGVSNETGEFFENLMEALENTNDNLMELLSSKYTFKEKLEEVNATDEKIDKVTYDNVMQDVYLSPAVKRTVWQAITICEEIRKIRKSAPKKIFLEMTRNPELKKERKDSRRNDLIKLYKSCKEDVSEFIGELESYDDRKLRAKALYLYYTQKGRCMYTGEKIDLSLILNAKDNALSLYDIDHIYPRSLTKDDSFDNLVLVKKDYNLRKSDVYPIDADTRQKMRGFWAVLKEQGFISSKKFYRLIRDQYLTTEELAGFINRQLVETGQSTKATADILKKLYPETEIIYTKAKTVSDFRHKFKLYKCRELNNFHHAHDAFLNIVAGNAYYTKFTANPYNYIKEEREGGKRRAYNLEKFFDNKVERKGYVAWNTDLHLPFVKKTLGRTTVNVARMPMVQKGKLFDIKLLGKKTDEKVLRAPIKGNDNRYADFSKYGSYNNVSGAYFFAVEHTVKSKRVITIEQVYLIYDNQIKTERDLLDYCKNILGLKDAIIVLEKIKMKSKILWNGFPLYLQGRSDNNLFFTVAKEINICGKNAETLRTVFKEYSVIKNNGELRESLIKESELISLYDEYISLLKHGEYKERPNNPVKTLEEGRDIFKDLCFEEKIKLVTEIHKLFSKNGSHGVDLKLIKGRGQMGTIKLGKNITKHSVVLINESPTGLYVNRKVLNKA
ncbi:MAG: type II CRISPR RNA-guided endonuclease Cas9 [Tissierellia bacterium]|nr:type II CRISPR RNA-guided endonuclease Cas9 [Tissierellia bacterium]